MNDEKAVTWALPSHLIVFLAKQIENIDNTARKFMLEPWPEFSRLIYDICDHRIENSPEINGSINNSYISLDEHLLMFFCLNDRKVSTREEIEYELLKFLYSLKYYSVRWPRARLFAQMLGFLKEGSKNFFAGSGQKNMSEVPNQYNVPAQFLRH